MQEKSAATIVAPVTTSEGAGVLRDGLFSDDGLSALLALLAESGSVAMRDGDIRGVPSTMLSELRGEAIDLRPRRSAAEQSNSSVFFGDRLIMKLFRRQQPGENPDTEIGRYRSLLGAFILDKALYELVYELNNRPAWVRIPLQGILSLTL